MAEFNLAWKPEPEPPPSAPSLGSRQSLRGQHAGNCGPVGCKTMRDSTHLQLAEVPHTILYQTKQDHDGGIWYTRSDAFADLAVESCEHVFFCVSVNVWFLCGLTDFELVFPH